MVRLAEDSEFAITLPVTRRASSNFCRCQLGDAEPHAMPDATFGSESEFPYVPFQLA